VITVLVFILILFLVITNLYLYLKAYYFRVDGDVVILHKDDGKILFSLELNEDPIDFSKKTFLIFKVVDEHGESE